MKVLKFYVLVMPIFGDIIQGRTLYKGGQYLRKYGSLAIKVKQVMTIVRRNLAYAFSISTYLG